MSERDAAAVLPGNDDARFDAAVARARGQLGRSHALWIDGRDHPTRHERVQHAPFDRGLALGTFAAATPLEAGLAIDAATRAFATWNATPAAERRGVVRRALERLEADAFEFGAILALEAGKPRREAMRETWGTAAQLVTYCDEWASHGWDVTPASQGSGHGPWAVFAPTHHPLALSAGPAAAALLAGNTVVIKAPERAAWAARRFIDLLTEAGCPPGVCNLLMGTADDLGDALLDDVRFAGATYVGTAGPMRILATALARSRHARPLLAEVPRKSAHVVTAHADLPAAARNIARMAFGLAGQHPHAPSHLLVHRAVADAFLDLLAAEARALHVGDPTQRRSDVGPLCSPADLLAYREVAARLHKPGARILCGAQVLAEDGLGAGNFAAPTIAEVQREGHPAWPDEVMAPVLLAYRCDNDGAMVGAVARLRRAHTAQVHGTPDERARIQRALRVTGRDDTGFDPVTWQELMPLAPDAELTGDAAKELHRHLGRYVRQGIPSR